MEISIEGLHQQNGDKKVHSLTSLLYIIMSQLGNVNALKHHSMDY